MSRRALRAASWNDAVRVADQVQMSNSPSPVIARLDRAIQYAVAHRIKHCRLWNTGCPACRLR
jgi:hypothetical protein